jgi:hypothetical protein
VLRAAWAQPPEPGAAGLPGRSGFRGAWSRARRPGGWPMENVDARCHGWSGILPPTRVTKKRTWTSPLCRRLPVCAVSDCVESAARSGSSCACVWCCDRTIVYRRHAISGSEQTSRQFWWCPAIALRLSRSLHVSQIWTHPTCCLMAWSTSWKIADGRLPREAIRWCAEGDKTAVRERAKPARVLSLLHECVVFYVKLTMPYARIHDPLYITRPVGILP